MNFATPGSPVLWKYPRLRAEIEIAYCLRNVFAKVHKRSRKGLVNFMPIGRRMRTARNSIYNFKKRGLSGQLTWHVIYENSTFRLIKRDPNLILPRIYLKKENIYFAMLGIQLIEHLPPIQITYRGTDTETTLIPWIDLEFAQNPPRIFANIIHIYIYTEYVTRGERKSVNVLCIRNESRFHRSLSCRSRTR